MPFHALLTEHPYIFCLVAVACSLFYGWNAVSIFSGPAGFSGSSTLVWRIHQFWFNFAGAFLGWMLLYKFCTLAPALAPGHRILHKGLLGIGAYLGITGYMPATVIHIPRLAAEAAYKALGLKT